MGHEYKGMQIKGAVTGRMDCTKENPSNPPRIIEAPRWATEEENQKWIPSVDPGHIEKNKGIWLCCTGPRPQNRGTLRFDGRHSMWGTLSACNLCGTEQPPKRVEVNFTEVTVDGPPMKAWPSLGPIFFDNTVKEMRDEFLAGSGSISSGVFNTKSVRWSKCGECGTDSNKPGINHHLWCPNHRVLELSTPVHACEGFLVGMEMIAAGCPSCETKKEAYCPRCNECTCGRKNDGSLEEGYIVPRHIFLRHRVTDTMLAEMKHWEDSVMKALHIPREVLVKSVEKLGYKY